jgi:phosphoglycolate phosphatase-like HAD superfamily hydrolase
MRNFINKKNIFWDFDGVIMDSMPVRNRGFEQVLKEFPNEQVALLMQFHQKNGGLSRYVKFRYFFEHIRGEVITDQEVQKWADKFSIIMINSLINPSLLIKEIFRFIKKEYKNYNMHIVSGSDQKELRLICKNLDIAKYFNSIHGSPTAKNDLVKKLLEKQSYNKKECVLIGDSINDLEAAETNNILFVGYNNPELAKIAPIFHFF